VREPRKKRLRLHALLQNLQNYHGLRQILFHVVEETFLEKHGVLMRGLLGGVSVSPRNRVDQLIVIAPKLCCSRRTHREVEVRMEQALLFSRKPFVVPQEVRVIRRMGDCHVQRLVRLGHCLEVSAGEGLHVDVVGLAKPGQIRRGMLRGSQPADCPLNEIESRNIFRELLNFGWRDQRSPVGQNGDQSFADESRKWSAT